MTRGAPAPLQDIRVLDFTHAAAGPFATMWLADLGAEIIKVEKPGRGDGSRFMGEPLDSASNSDYYSSLNRNKLGVSIDLQTDDGAALARSLVRKCDVVIQNFRPGVMDRLGLGFAECAQLRPGLVYCSISAFGPDGPWRDRPANDIIMQGVTGLMALTGEPEGDPVRAGTPICDYATGLFGVVGVLAALFARRDHPSGQHIEMNMFDSTIAVMANYIPSVLSLGRAVKREGRGHAQLVPYQAFRCGDDQYLIVGAFTDAFWRRLCAAIQREDLVLDSRFSANADRVASRHTLIPILEEVFMRRPRQEWLAALERADVPCTPVLTLDEALRSDQAKANATVAELANTSPHLFTAAMPVRSAEWPSPRLDKPPSLGADTERVLHRLLGLSEEHIKKLAASGVVGLDS